MDLAKKEIWDRLWSNYTINKIGKDYFLMDLLREYLPVNSQYECLEIGCIPGSFLIALHKNFQYKIYGIDYSDQLWATEQNFKFNEIHSFKLFKEDVLTFDKHKFDIVCSFGFIEHFDDVSPYIDKMCQLVRENGYLIIGLPNFKIVSRIVSSIRKTHNTKIMDIDVFEKKVLKPNFRKIYLGYYPGFITDKTLFINKKSFAFIWGIIMKMVNLASKMTNAIARSFCNIGIDLSFLKKYICFYIIYIGKKLKYD